MAGAAAAPYVFGGPVWDDHTLINGTLVTLNDAGLAALWQQPVGGSGPGEGYYRPLAMTLLAVAGRVGMPLIHLLVAACHVTSAVLLLCILRPLPAAFPAAAIFAVHPLSSEVLGWASALPDALAICAGLLAAVAGGPMGALVATLCGLLAKEVALLILPALVAAGLVERRLLLGWLAAVGLWALLRMSAGTGAGWDWSDRLHLVPAALLWPVYSMVIPHPLTAVRDLLSVPAFVPFAGGGFLVLGIVLGRQHRAAWVGLGLVLAAALLALPPTLDGYLAAERYAYAGLVGLSIFLAATLPSMDRRLLGGMCVLGIGLQIHNSQRWQADVPLFAAATELMPSSSFSWHLLGHALAQSGRFSEAADSFGQAIAAGHPYPDDAQLRLIALVQAGRAGEAVAWAEAGPREGLTADWIAWWARAAHDTGDIDRARSLIQMLYSDQKWDGPAWVPELAAQVQSSP